MARRVPGRPASGHGTPRATPRRTWWVVGAAALGALTGCSGSPAVPPTPHPTTPAPHVTFTAHLTTTADSLTWEYALRNDGSTPVAVFNGPDRATPDDPAPVWVVNAGGGRVEVSQRLHDLPPGVAAAQPAEVGVSTLEPGESLEGSASVPLPLRLAYPYAAVADHRYALPDHPKEVTFCLGIMAQARGDEPFTWYPHGGAATSLQHRVCTEPAPLG